MSGAIIRKLKIERFRGIKSLTWLPAPGVNMLLGGGDVGKSTVLEAIGLLLGAGNTVLADADYFARSVADEFSIEAVLSLPARAGINQQIKMHWPWEWVGQDIRQPQHEGVAAGEAVYCVRVRGTNESDLIHEIVQPDGSTDTFAVALRRTIGLVRLSGDDRNDRDLRLVYGSALDRLLDDKSLRSRLGIMLAKDKLEDKLVDEAKRTLEKLDTTFKKKELPTSLGLGLTGGPGLSLGALVGLTAHKQTVALPLASWGAGTRRLAALAIANSLQAELPITVVDELERGLEPYRQRGLVADLEASSCQVFVTTHSSTAIHASKGAALWYIDAGGKIAELKGDPVKRLRTVDPETFLARLAIIAEGRSEQGFVYFFLKKALGSDPLVHGVWVTDGGGHEESLKLLEDLSSVGLAFGGFVDEEGGLHPQRWAAVKSALGGLLFRWNTGSLEDNVIPLFKDKLDELIEDPSGRLTGRRLRTLADRVGLEGPDKSLDAICKKATDNGIDVVQLIIAAAAGRVPATVTDEDTKKAWKRDGQDWFKTREGGNELATKILQLGLWSQLQDRLLPFLNAVRSAIRLSALTNLPS